MVVSASSREPSVTRPPWLSFLMEPAWTALEQAEAALRSIEGQLMTLPPEHFRALREGVNGSSAAETNPSSHVEHPEDAAWLAAESARLKGLEAREMADLTATLEARLGAEVADAIIGGATLAELGVDVDADLERLVERLRGFTGEGEG